MDDIDAWLGTAAARTSAPLSVTVLQELDRRIGSEAEPSMFMSRREGRRAMFTAAISALVGFAGSGVVASEAFAQPRATWVAAPSPSSPFGLLVGR
ncbi:CnrY/NccY family anti-sigma factor [Sphingomonas sp. AR_OL41]|uniref:CnrY/NccY family anti-sigma factor n=1 Tax=Sphingomonas sp. AR_OL41 TaxID=3042729 RepID=UPI00247FF740|nr:CnrY/NccY family anti-sigma factor [Sphingomonas sp. AR_OL41]MDH7972495.1 CnrY/NccY family anti-sigma factor [Sphingomonas sp. AR_OL41]